MDKIDVALEKKETKISKPKKKTLEQMFVCSCTKKKTKYKKK